MTALHGCIPIVCTPFHDDGSLDLANLEREVDWLIGEGASGVAGLAIASEGFKLTESERAEVTGAIVSAAGGRVPVVISANGDSPQVAVDRARKAAEAGASALMVLPPVFVKPDRNGLFDYYAAVGRAVEIPVIIQDAPQVTVVGMGPALWWDLAREIETIRYIKAEGMPQGNTISQVIAISDGALQVFCGWGGIGLIDALQRGAAGSMPAPNFTRFFSDCQRLYERGDFRSASNLFREYLPFVVWSIQSVDHSVGAAKEEMRRRGVIESAAMRPPFIPFDDVAVEQLSGWIDWSLRQIGQSEGGYLAE